MLLFQCRKIRHQCWVLNSKKRLRLQCQKLSLLGALVNMHFYSYGRVQRIQFGFLGYSNDAKLDVLHPRSLGSAVLSWDAMQKSPHIPRYSAAPPFLLYMFVMNELKATLIQGV